MATTTTLNLFSIKNDSTGDNVLVNFELLRVIGAGGFGRALLVRRRIDGCNLVLKEVALDTLGGGEKYREMARAEAEMLSTFLHPNIVTIYSYFEEQGCLYLELEFCKGGDLAQVISEKEDKDEFFDEIQIKFWFAQIADAVEYLHQRKILHRDIKSQNIFLTEDKTTLKIGDFGIAKILDQTAQMVTTRIGTCTHFSPEFCEDQPYNAKADVWAVGVVLYEMTTLNLPYMAANELQIYKKIIKGVREPIPSQYSQGLAKFIDSLMAQEPEERPEMREVVKNDWLKEGMEHLETMRSIQKQQESKNEQIYQQKIVPFQGNYWKNFQSLIKRPDRWFIAPCGIRDFAIVNNLTIVFCNSGQVICFGSLFLRKTAHEQVLWRSRLAIKAKYSLHCAGDSLNNRIYISFENEDGIFSVTPEQLASTKITQPNNLNEIGIYIEEYEVITPVEPQTFVRGRLPFPNKRSFHGLACNSESRLLFCCDASTKQNIAVYSTFDGKMLFQIACDGAPTSITSKFAPNRCDFYLPSSILAVSDYKNSRLHLFQIETKKSNKGLTISSSKWVKNEILKGSNIGEVRYPLGCHFDAVGNLWLADSGNSRLQLFSIVVDQTSRSVSVKSLSTLETRTKGWTMRAITLTDIDREGEVKPFVLCALANGVDALREIICFTSD